MAKFVTFGEIMARLQPPAYGRLRQALPGTLQVTFAGSEANVAASLAYLGEEAEMLLPSQQDVCANPLREISISLRKGRSWLWWPARPRGGLKGSILER